MATNSKGTITLSLLNDMVNVEIRYPRSSYPASYEGSSYTILQGFLYPYTEQKLDPTDKSFSHLFYLMFYI